MSKVEMGINLQKDISGPEKEKQEPGLELVRNEQLDNVVDAADDLHRKMEGDMPVTDGDVLKLEEALNQVKVDFYGDEITIEEIQKIPDLKNNMEIWDRIKKGDIEVTDFTFITPSVMRILLDTFRRSNHGWLTFTKLQSISEGVANTIADFDGNDLVFDAVNSLSDEVVRLLCKSKCRKISLQKLLHVSDHAIEMLSEKIFNLSSKIVVSPEIFKRAVEYSAKNKK